MKNTKTNLFFFILSIFIMSQQITPEVIKNLENTGIIEDPETIIPKLSENAHANTYPFNHGRYFFDSDSFLVDFSSCTFECHWNSCEKFNDENLW
ncbi:hypothetical protein FACS189472_09730 [Alphaproteobacteria bacterium]|nr:hypothetical protein FACS189472_09730 [Alphaproteobacteria bacterium]